jgi:hypothetical protein
MNTADYENLSERLTGVLQETLTGGLRSDPQFRGGELQGWALVSRWVAPDGEPFYLVNESAGASVPEVLGWLEYTKEIVRMELAQAFREQP